MGSGTRLYRIGNALSAAVYEQIDATPMEGLYAESLDAILRLNEKDLLSVLIKTAVIVK